MLKFTVTPDHEKDAELAKTMEAVMNFMVSSGEFDALADQVFEDGLKELIRTGHLDN